MPVSAAPGDELDLLIRNARVVDGTGNPWFFADVAVRAGRIVAVGRLDHEEAARVIDAAGRIVAPGFIDVHTHIESRSTGGIQRLPRADNLVKDGVTTVVTGNCGSSQVDLGAWFGKLESLGLGINVSALVGHNSVRREVMGEVARPASGEELAKMRDLVEQAMRDGAVGLSTGLLYIPGTFADTAEVVELARVAARFGGVYATHLREQGAHLIESIEEALEVGRAANLPVQISHLKVKGKVRWGTIGSALKRIERGRREGIDVVFDIYPYDRASSSLSAQTLPGWALDGGRAGLAKRLADPEERARVVAVARTKLEEAGYGDYSYATVASYEPEPELEGQTIPAIAAGRGREGVDGQIETLLELVEGGRVQMVFRHMGISDVEDALRHPLGAMASDGGVRDPAAGRPHPRSWGTRARVFAWLVRERGALRLEEAVRRMTSLPARTFGFTSRGQVRPGLVADLVVFDPERVQDRATFLEPHQFSEGFDWVIVAGQPVIAEGEWTDARPGRVLRQGAESRQD